MKFYGLEHDLVEYYTIPISQKTMNTFPLSSPQTRSPSIKIVSPNATYYLTLNWSAFLSFEDANTQVSCWVVLLKLRFSLRYLELLYIFISFFFFLATLLFIFIQLMILFCYFSIVCLFFRQLHKWKVVNRGYQRSLNSLIDKNVKVKQKQKQLLTRIFTELE